MIQWALDYIINKTYIGPLEVPTKDSEVGLELSLHGEYVLCSSWKRWPRLPRCRGCDLALIAAPLLFLQMLSDAELHFFFLLTRKCYS